MNKFLQLPIIFCILAMASCSGFPVTHISTSTQVNMGTTSPSHICPPISGIETSAPLPYPYPATTLPISWAKDIQGNWLYLGEYNGLWAPNSNELILIKGTSKPFQNATIKIAAPPFFDPQTITSVDFFYPQMNAIWSPDGQFILFNGPYPATPPYQSGYSSIWMVEKSGNNSHSLQPSQPTNHRELSYGKFLGWVDDQTLVYTYGFGSGFGYIEGIDIYSGKPRFSETLSSGILAPHGDYIPFEALGTIRVMDTKYYDPEKELVEAPYIRNPKINGENVNGIFQGWLPNSNKMLILHPHQEKNSPSIQLQLVTWDLETDYVTLIFPNAVSAQLSGDGKTIACLSFGPIPLNPSRKPLENGFNLESKNLPLYVQLYDLDSQTITYASPVLEQDTIKKNESDNIIDYLHPTTYMSFSPDGAYFAFLAPDSPVTLKIIDTSTQKIVFSFPSISQKNFGSSKNSGELLSWSPDSKKLLYRDSQGNPTILYMGTGKKLPVTESGGLQVDASAWSFDGQYLFVSFYEEENCQPQSTVFPESAVIKIP